MGPAQLGTDYEGPPITVLGRAASGSRQTSDTSLGSCVHHLQPRSPLSREVFGLGGEARLPSAHGPHNEAHWEGRGWQESIMLWLELRDWESGLCLSLCVTTVMVFSGGF